MATFPRKQQLLSWRFAQDSATAIQSRLPESQRLIVESFQRRLESSQCRLISEECPCQTGVDTIVAQIDRYGLHLSTVHCSSCGTLRTNPYLDDDGLDHFYRTTYQAMYARAPQLDHYFDCQSGYGTRVAALYEREFSSPGHVLEIGCGAGGGLAAFQQHGHCVAGCDPSRELVKYGTRRGVPNLWYGTIEKIPQELASQRWDLIFLHHVFEHVQSPVRALKSLLRFIKPRGRILAIVPDILRIDQFPNPAGDALKFLHIAHKFNFTMAGLQSIARRAGLVASARVPPAHLATAWSDMPELWIEFKPTELDCPEPNPQRNVGPTVLNYLLTTERRFLAEHNLPSSHQDVGNPIDLRRDSNSPSGLPPRNRRQIWRWLRGRSKVLSQ